MAAAAINSNPKFIEVLTQINTKGYIETTFGELLGEFGGSVQSAQLPSLVKAFQSVGLAFSPDEWEGGHDTPRIVRPIRSIAIAVDEAKQRIRAGESEKIEFKSSLRYNYKIAELDRGRLAEAGVCNIVRDQALKAICGLYNSNGGDLFIGVRDNGAVVGIEPDFDLLKRPRPEVDERDLWRQQLISDMQSRFYEATPVIQRTHVELVELESKLVARVTVHPGDRLAFVRYSDGAGDRHRAFVRQSVTTRELEPTALEEYIRVRTYHLRPS